VLPLAVAGLAVTAGTVAGLLVPPVAGRPGASSRTGSRASPSPPLLAAGRQLFYSSLFALISDVVGERQKDRPFAVVAMVRSACFGLGALAAGGLLTAGALRAAVAVDAASFLVAALVLAVGVRAPHTTGTATTGRISRRFPVLVATTGLIALSTDFFLVGLPVYVLDLGAPPWLPGVVLALHTAVTSTCGTLAVRLTRDLPRTTTLARAAWLTAAWCALCLAAAALPHGWRPAWFLGAALVLAAAGVP
jgi:hypothetical protein